MPMYQAVKRIESRGEGRKKTVIKAGTQLKLTKSEAEKLGNAVVPVKAGYVPTDKAVDDTGTGGDGGDGGGDGGGKDPK